MVTNTALHKGLKSSLFHHRQTGRICQMSWCQAHLCVLAFNSHESTYVTLVEALCDEQQINLIKVHDSEELGPGQASVKLTEGGQAMWSGWLQLW